MRVIVDVPQLLLCNSLPPSHDQKLTIHVEASGAKLPTRDPHRPAGLNRVQNDLLQESYPSRMVFRVFDRHIDEMLLDQF